MLIVREAHQTDLEAWSEMRFKLWPSATAQEHLWELKQMFGLNTFKGWVAIDGENRIGFAEASIRPYANGCESKPVVFFEGIFVEAQHRKSGVGRNFVQAIEDWARSLGIYEVGSDAELQNTLSHLCHRKWGFDETERVIYYRKKL